MPVFAHKFGYCTLIWRLDHLVDMRIHLISIGGAVMHNLALALAAEGHLVSGSDDRFEEPSGSRLKKAGLLPEQTGWFPGQLSGEIDLVILGMHAKADNPELIRAQELGLKILSFPEYVAQRTAGKLRLVVAGSHGKTTITAMVMHVLRFHKRQFDYLVGSGVKGFDVMVRLTDNAPVVVIEGDEYLSSCLDLRPKFLHYAPQVLVISGIAWDHANVFSTPELYREAFRTLLLTLSPGARVGYPEGDTELEALCTPFSDTLAVRSYKPAEYVVEDGYGFLKTSLGKIPLLVFGRHNVENIAAARFLTAEAGIPKEDFYQAVASFPGADRRLERVGHHKDHAVYRDFAHAPSKVRASVRAVREQHPELFLTAILELHTFSSLRRDFLPQYRDSMNLADRAVVFYQPALASERGLQVPDVTELRKFFGRSDLEVRTEPGAIVEESHKAQRNGVLLLMSSATFGGLSTDTLLTNES
ncbi:MAG: peptidoglycan synthetase [Sphingomonadales bacterium]|nr:peptidoglycan synthetase [Sphingomonadales bacterium]